jgi:SPP1 gp7 family putative phage head morphogenesis protein
MEDIEKKAQASVLRFFNSVYRRMLNYSQPVTDSAILDFSEESILTILEDSWDSEESKYQVSIVNQMAAAGVIGAARAALKVEEKRQQTPSEIKIQPRITKQDIHDDLLEQSSQRIKGIKDTTLKQIRESLAEGFNQDLGWKNIMKQLQPIIVNEVRAEMIAISELSWAYLRGEKRVYKKAGFSRVELNEVMDTKTCPVCRARNGKIVDIDSSEADLAHPRCRVSLLPVD